MSEQMDMGILGDLDREKEEKDAIELAAHRVEEKAEQRRMWMICWDWDGPVVGGMCQACDCISGTVYERFDLGHQWIEVGEKIYNYMEQIRIIEQLDDETWVGEIAMPAGWWGEGKDWHTDGMKLKLGVMDIWPPVRELG